ncbi:hypothetical protein FUAX_11500 [Fulvitalea axinellae]|uniref:Outer membrane protein beta-barrel domain-containing protein n=1 Tax=Fulvitalea axinellae TaxID=1182444 RepID=A0AAU9CL07_9BACT|nr:hypothetical protein FUAX_11500 [Fulvitalea axinellae]
MRYFFYVSFTLLVCVSGFSGVRAQDTWARNEFGLGVGWFTVPELEELTADLVIPVASGGVLHVNDGEVTTSFGVSYRFFLLTSLGVGLDFVYQHENKTLNTKVGGTVVDTQKLKQDYLTFLPEVYWEYVQSRYFTMYVSLGLGVSLLAQNNKDTKSGDVEKSRDSFFAYQASVLGLRVSTFDNRLGFYIEGGYGYRGVISAGFAIRF